MSKHWSHLVTLDDGDSRGGPTNWSARQSQGANQDRTGMAQSEWVALTDFIVGGEREALPKGKYLMLKIGTYETWAKLMPGVASVPLQWL